MYLEKLVESAKRTKSILCFCLDPLPEHIPLIGFLEHRITEYYIAIFNAMDKAQCYPAALKFNEAYFLALDDPFTTCHGSNALRELVLKIRSHPTLSILPMIMDCKRCDIGKSAERYAKYYFEKWKVDAITVSPYTGEEGLAPFEKYEKKGVYVLAKTSNNASVQDMAINEHGALSRWMCQWISAGNEKCPSLGAVVSGRDTNDVAQHLSYLSPTVPLLIPGIGTQGGNAKEITAIIAKTQNPLYHRIAIGSSIAYAWTKKNDPTCFAERALEALKTENETILGELNGII